MYMCFIYMYIYTRIEMKLYLNSVADEQAYIYVCLDFFSQAFLGNGDGGVPASLAKFKI